MIILYDFASYLPPICAVPDLNVVLVISIYIVIDSIKNSNCSNLFKLHIYCNKSYFFYIIYLTKSWATFGMLSLHQLWSQAAPFVFSKTKVLKICRKTDQLMVNNKSEWDSKVYSSVMMCDHLHVSLIRQIFLWITTKISLTGSFCLSVCQSTD